MIGPEEALSLWSGRKKHYNDLHTRMKEIDSIYDGTATVPLPDANKNEPPSVPNLLAQGIDQTAARIASVVPKVTFSATKPGQRRSERNATTAERTVTAWWQADRMSLKMKRRARHLIAYAMAPVVMRYDEDDKRPTWKLRDPRTTYPSVETYGDHFTPENVMFSFLRNISWLVDHGYGEAVAQVTGRRLSDLNGDTQMQVLEYVDEYGTCVYLTGYSDPYRAGEQTTMWTPPSYMQVPDSHRCVMIEHIPTPDEMMLATVPTRIALNGPAGQFDTMISTFYTWARMNSLEILAAEKGIFPDTYLIGRPGETPDFLSGPHDGRTGKVNIVTGGAIQTEQYAPGYMTTPMLDRLERSQRLTAGIAAEFGGESGSNIRTARRGDAVLSGMIDYPIAEAQEVFAYALVEENKAAIKLAKMYNGTAPVSIYVNIGNESRKVEYVANEVFEHEEHVVSYPITGTDINTLLMTNGQRVGLGTMSKRTAMETDPAVANPEYEHDRIIAEGLESALVSGIQQQAASGQIPPLTLARVMALVENDRMELPEALNKVAEEAAKEAQAQEQAQAQSAQQMSAGPTAEALTGSPIPGPSEGQADLATLMSTLRKPTMTVQPGRGMAQGAV